MTEGSPKADQWRNLATVLVVATYHAWQQNGVIPDTNAPRPRAKSKAASKATAKERIVQARLRELAARDPAATHQDLEDAGAMRMCRNYRAHFDTLIEHMTAIRLWATHQISPQNIRRAQACHGRACRSWVRMHAHLTPNFHLSEHNEDHLLRYGPFPSWWGFPMEQHNGFMKGFRLNGHTGGELEATMMRGWWKYSLLSDLVRVSLLCYPSIHPTIYRCTGSKRCPIPPTTIIWSSRF